MRQPKILLRNNNKFEIKNFNFGSTVNFKGWAERIGANRYSSKKMHNLTFREATLLDIPQMQVIRQAVKENVLSDPKLVTDRDYEKYIPIKGSSWVCENNNQIVGFSIADLPENNVWALFVAPAFEGKGIGKQLHHLMLNWYFTQTQKPIWLSTDPNTRAETFYRKQGWLEVGLHHNEIKFEMPYAVWETKKNL